jgi:soluble P-type ATPase/copper chaperone CopZ
MRPGAADAVQRLSRAGVRTVMLTGDNERSARAIAHRVGVDEYRAQLLPTDKVDVIRQLKEEPGTVAMVGDGINDAPAMAVADVGIAMGAAGTDIAIEAGDVVLMSDDLGKIAFIRELSHRTVTTIRQNIAVSLINVAFMVVAALLGYLGLVTGLLLNEASAVFVILNALRLLTWRSSSERGVPGGSVPLPAITTQGEGGASNPAAGCCCSSGVEPVAAGLSGYHSVATDCCGEPDGAVAPSSAVPETSSSGCGCTLPTIPASGNISSCCGCENSQDRSPPTGSCCSCETEEAPVQEAASTGCCSKGPAAATKNPGLLAATYHIEGLGCACEGQIVEKRLKEKEGITFFSLNPITNQMKLIYHPSILSRQEIETEVKKAGATPVFVKSEAVSVSTGSTLSKKGYGE